MKNQPKNIIIVILIIVVLGLMGYIMYDKVLQDNNVDNSINNTPNENESNNKESLNQESKGKIYIKRDGVLTLEEVPTGIVGKYVNNEIKDDYFILDSDGTAVISFPSGDRGTIVTNQKLTYQLTYTKYIVYLELYTSEGAEPPSPIMIGQPTQGGYSFAPTMMTPSAGAGRYVYDKVEN